MRQPITQWLISIPVAPLLMPPRRRGFAAGINEFADYFGLSTTAFLTGLIAAEYGLRPRPFAALLTSSDPVGASIHCLSRLLLGGSLSGSFDAIYVPHGPVERYS
jgi:hypothetical protein